MPRRYYYRRRSLGGRDKYSIEQAAGVVTLSSGNGAVAIVPSVNFQGMRKVKHITINLANGAAAATGTLYWAIVYVPAGTNANTLNIEGESLYEPNQYVMNAGIYDPETGPGRISSPLARNLNSGDQIALVIRAYSSSSSIAIQYVARYAITLQ